jgi:hypothetical protein
MELYDELDIVTEIKRMRLRWLGHMERMSDGRSTCLAQRSFIATNQKA